ncbi:MAG: hypothetical protein E7J52_09540, partial [Streptococcus agalactiae]|nr:hypothetical protein [Streptococcus agalactiae]
YFTQISQYYWFMGEFGKNIKKTNIKNDVCLHSDQSICSGYFVSDLFIIIGETEKSYFLP